MASAAAFAPMLPTAVHLGGPLRLPQPSGQTIFQLRQAERATALHETYVSSPPGGGSDRSTLASSSSLRVLRRCVGAADLPTGLRGSCASVFVAVAAVGVGRRRQPLRKTRRQRHFRFVAQRATTVTAAAEVREDSDSDEDELPWQQRQATPRERQFYGAPGGRSRSASKSEPVVLPISNLHIAVAQRQLPMLLDMAGPTVGDGTEVIAAWSELLQACKEQAPDMLDTWNAGVGPLLRLAVAVPRQRWLRSPSEPWALPKDTDAPAPSAPSAPSHIAKDDGSDEMLRVEPQILEGPEEGAAVLPQLEALVKHLLCKYELPGVLARGLVWSDGAGGMVRECPGREVVLCSAAGLEFCIRFTRLLAEVGAGEMKPIAAAKEILSPGLTKKMVGGLLSGPEAAHFPGLPPVEVPTGVRHVQPESVEQASPLAALRVAQVVSLGGTEALGKAVVGTRLGKDLGTPEEEEFAESVMAWLCRFADAPELADVKTQRQAVDWLLEQRDLDPAFAVNVAGNPRAPKKVIAAAEREAGTLLLQRLQTSGQRFQRNPAGVKGFVKRGVVCPVGSPFEVFVPDLAERMGFVNVPNSWHGDEYEPSEVEKQFMAKPDVQRRCTVRIDEIMSFEYLQHVGMQMRNCLRVEKRGGASLVKYLNRVRARDSSFWVMTITPEAEEEENGETSGRGEEAKVQYMLMIELYNDLKVIHQAEGPHPRRWPRPDAWQWLKEWADREGLVPDGPEGVTVGPYGAYDGSLDKWDIGRCFLW